MSDLHSAVIIPFPGQRPPAVEDSLERLRRALLTLDDALAEQREAVAHWRGVMHELKGSVGGLGSALCSYQNALSALDGKVAVLSSEANALVAWSEQVPGSHTDATTPD